MTSGKGHAFTGPEDGDMRAGLGARRRVSERLAIASDWATVDQVHGAEVVTVARPGPAGSADGLVTVVEELPLAVFTADCLGVVMSGPGTVGVAHAGWRGLACGVIEATGERMAEMGCAPGCAFIGPGIGPCCFEVGPEVAERFPEDLARTTWGTTSIDLVAAARRRLAGLPVEEDGRCTACGGGFSHRRDGTAQRMAALGWVV